MNSFTGIFWKYFKPPPCAPPYIDLSPSPRSNFDEPPQWTPEEPPMARSQHLLETLYIQTYINKKYLYLRFEDISLKLTPPSPNLLALRDSCLNDPTLSFSILGPAELLVVTCFQGDLLRGVLLFPLWWDISKFGLLILMASLLWLEAEYFFLSTGLRTCVSFSGGSWDSTVKLKT